MVQKWVATAIWLREMVITIVGLIALISPVMLWTAWSVTVFHAVLAAGCGAILMLYFLFAFFADDDYRRETPHCCAPRRPVMAYP